MNSLKVLLERWHHEEVDALPPVSEELVRLTFSKLGVIPTRDVIDLYGAIGGMRMMDNEYWRLWPLSEIVERFAEANEYGVLFSDYCLDCWAYRIKPRDSTTTAVYVDHFDGKPPSMVAESLTQFFDLYVANARNLLDNAGTNHERV
jgi:hypothetical protein